MSNATNTSLGDAAAAKVAAALNEKVLTFKLGEESYGIGVLKIREIIRMQKITPVPQMPGHVKGVINLRGKVIPVIDLRTKFNVGSDDTTERTCIVVVNVEFDQHDEALIGLIVDAVEEVLNISGNEIEAAPDIGSDIDQRNILGIARVRSEVKTLLDIDRVIREDAAVLASS